MSNPSPATTPQKPLAMRVLRGVFVLAVIIGGGALIAGEAEAIGNALVTISPFYLLPAMLAALAHVATAYLAWRGVLVGNSLDEGKVARGFFIGQLGKYLPGGIWSYVAVAEYGRDAGLPRAATWSASALALVAALFAGAGLALFALPDLPVKLNSQASGGLLGQNSFYLAAILLVSVAVTIPAYLRFIAPYLARKFAGFAPPSLQRFAIASAVKVIVWLCGGGILYFLIAGLGLSLDKVSFITLAAIYATAWFIGFAVFIAPAGLGAREGAMATLLALFIPLGEALVVALLARILVTIADFIAGGVFLLLPERPSGERSFTA